MTENLEIKRYFTKPGEDVYKNIEWTKSDVIITDEQRKPLFTQKNVEAPKWYSQLARKVIASRYFYGDKDTLERESSVRQLIGRVCETITGWGVKQGYLNTDNAAVFNQELSSLCLTQRGAFNSPVWFNVGTDRYESRKTKDTKLGYIILNNEAVLISPEQYHLYPQTSACFIQHVDDTMESIMQLAINEAMLFKDGSGTGTDLSTLRSSREKISGGGKPSGPLAYLSFYDRVAGIVKSGGKTRRAAKMDSLRVEHPDIKEFITAKAIEQRKKEVLMDLGNYTGSEAADTVHYQNTNLSVRVTDAFMRAVENNEDWQTIPVHSNELAEKMPKYKAKDLMKLIAEGTHICGDPGMQYHDTINKWHTCPNSAPINASNPCSEYMSVDNSSCNLASLNLMSFVDKDGKFNTKDFGEAIRTLAIAQDLLYDNSSFPTKEIAQNSHDFRPLGMGYANLGALLMFLGVPYDSDEGRAVAASITSYLTGKVYETSVEIAKTLGPFKEFKKNKEPMLNVMNMHKEALKLINNQSLIRLGLEHILNESKIIWDNVIINGNKYGYRNSQATVLAPTGTIGFMMDCDTTGVEPDIALVKYKLLAEGGTLKIVNYTVGPALERLGYSDEKVKSIIRYINENDTIEGSELKEGHLPVFDCSFKAKKGKRSISTMGHVKMMSAVQPFLSGAISKTVNMNKEATVEEIQDVYMQGWKMGLKAIAIYRDGSNRDQPLTTAERGKLEEKIIGKPYRRKLPGTRNSITHKFDVAGHEGYLTAGLYDDKNLGEIFINISKEGSTMGGMSDVWATTISLALQYGVPLKALTTKFKNQKFEPRGLVGPNKEGIHTAESIPDYIAQWLEKTFLNGSEKKIEPASEELIKKLDNLTDVTNPNNELDIFQGRQPDGGFCIQCGTQMFKFGHCEERCPKPDCGHIDYNGCGK